MTGPNRRSNSLVNRLPLVFPRADGDIIAGDNGEKLSDHVIGGPNESSLGDALEGLSPAEACHHEWGCGNSNSDDKNDPS